MIIQTTANRYTLKNATTLIALLALFLAACRGTRSDDPPIHLNLNMDYQERFDPQEANPFFVDNRSMRTPVPGTVARGMLREDVGFYEGRTEGGDYVEAMPIPATREVLKRGQARYDIFCAPCHGGAGDGDGIITTGGYGYTPAPTYHSDRLRNVADGYLYDVITSGIRTMPAYAHQIPVADRWAIVGYIRALQRSQYAPETDVPPSLRTELRRAAAAGGGAGESASDTTAADTTGGAASQSADTTAQAAGDNQ